MFRITLILCSFSLLVGACGNEPSTGMAGTVDQTMQVLHRGVTSELHTTLDSFFRSEKADYDKLQSKLSAESNGLDNIRVGTPMQIADATAEINNLRGAKVEELATIQVPVIAAKAAVASAEEKARSFNGEVRYYGRAGYCGNDGCGGDCGTCDPGKVCFSDFCRKIPECAQKRCGSNDAGGICGTCDSDERCTKTGACVARTSNVTAEFCKAECKASHRGPYTKVTKKAKNPDFPGSWRKERSNPGFRSIGDLRTFTKNVDSKYSANTALIAKHEKRQGQIDGLANKVTSLEAQTKAAKAKVDSLGKELKSAQKGLKAAKKDQTDLNSVNVAQSKVDAISGALGSAKADKSAKADELKKTKAELKALKKVHKAATPSVKTAVAAQPHLNKMSKTYAGVISKWQAALDAVDSANKASSAAEATAATKTNATEARYAQLIKNAQDKLAALNKAAIAEGDRPTFEKINNLTHDIARAAHVIPGDFVSKVGALKGEKAQALAELKSKIEARKQAEANDEALGGGPSSAVMEGWAGTLDSQVDSLELIGLVIPALNQSNDRAGKLRQSIIAERTRHTETETN